MAGKVQHEIPRLYQRGFLIQDGSGIERVFVFRRGGNTHSSNIDRSGAQTYFYSKPSIAAKDALDDKITSYEERHLGSLVASLRAVPVGSTPDPGMVAEVAAHLTTRNAHLRGVFAHGVTAFAATASRVFGEEEDLRRMLGLDRPTVSDVLREALSQAFINEPHITALGIPHALLERMAIAKIREDFPQFFQQQRPMLEAMLRALSAGASSLVSEAHRKALHQTLVPKHRVEDLGNLRWQIVAAESDLILPDCIALAIDKEKRPLPLMTASSNDIESVLLPLTSRTLLIGTRGSRSNYNPAHFNLVAASCSHHYFICASNGSGIRDLMDFIGTRSVIVVDSAIGEAFLEYAPERATERSPGHPNDASSPRSATPAIRVFFQGNFDAEVAQNIADTLTDLLVEVAWTVPLDRLDGITFADDYPSALGSLDRGVPGSAPLSTRRTEKIIGIAQCPNVVRDGIIKCHIVAQADLGRALIGEDDDAKAWAICVLANQLAHAGITQVVDEALPGALRSPVTDELDAILQPSTYPSWNSYFAARAVGRLGEHSLRNAQEVLLIAVREAFDEIPRARLAYREHGSIDDLLSAVLPRIALILELAASLLGYATALERDPLGDAPELEAELRSRELHAWLTDFSRDLDYLWNRRGQWDSFAEFIALNRHAERLLWPFCIFPWMTPEGRCRVEVPIEIDAQALEPRDSSHVK